jgi:hypothetical protein
VIHARGSAEAQTNLGIFHELGHFAPQDFNEAPRWFRLAAGQDCCAAQNRMIVGILAGRFIPLDPDEGWKWYQMEERFSCIKPTRKGAERGDASEQWMFGIFHETGFGVQRDLIEAYKWFRLAAAQGNELAVARLAAVSAAITTGLIREGERRACEFKPVE